MRQLELGSDKEHAHMCAWCSRMIAPDPNEKSANTQGCGARKRQRAVRSGKRQRAVRSGKAAKSRAKRKAAKSRAQRKAAKSRAQRKAAKSRAKRGGERSPHKSAMITACYNQRNLCNKATITLPLTTSLSSSASPQVVAIARYTLPTRARREGGTPFLQYKVKCGIFL